MARHEAPLIAINGLLENGDEPRLALSVRYADAVLRAGGSPLVIAPVGGPRDIEQILERVDGVVLSGGDDFRTERLGLGPTHPEADPTPAEKQDWDAALARAVIDGGVPVLGICYGMQLLALVDGGNIDQHLPESRPECLDHRGGVTHDVSLALESKLGRLVGVDRMEVISRHHQAISEVAGSWRVCARDDEDLIEAIEHLDHPFAIGVQWHPELSPEGDPSNRVFRGLVDAAGARADRRLLGRPLVPSGPR